jgi:hypothetical protein
MYNALLIDDFERTESTDELHAILGRALIVATRFDSMCKEAARHNGLYKVRPALYTGNDENLSLLLKEVAKKYTKLTSSIESLKLPKDISLLLGDAIAARNIIAHDLAQGLTGCLGIRTNGTDLIHRVYDLVFALAHGDIVISHVLSVLNEEPLPNAEILSAYVDKVTRWVIDR